jgi:uncharacterized membrane protein YidH (DUF202 family)
VLTADRSVPTTSASRSTDGPARPANRWVHGPVSDVLLGWCWLPIALLAHTLEGHLVSLQALIAVVFLLSFAHQPLTLGLVYGDRAQRASRPRLYAVAPFVMLALVLAGVSISLTLVALVAGMWNAEHTLMQRFGVMRIYGRKAGDDHAKVEKVMLFSWLALAVTFLGGFVALDKLVEKVGIGRTNRRSVELLHSGASVLRLVFVPLAVVAAIATLRWLRSEHVDAAHASTPKRLYVLSTAALVVFVMVDPVAGFVGYVAAHSIEYFAIVHSSLRKRAATGDASAVARATASMAKRALVYAAYFAVIAAMIYFGKHTWDGTFYAFAILYFGGLHILYDGFVWKLRKPATAASLGITPAAAGVAPAAS